MGTIYNPPKKKTHCSGEVLLAAVAVHPVNLVQVWGRGGAE